jgi:CysZ protein
MTPTLTKPGFGEGFLTVFVAGRFLTREPATWPIALVPTLIFAAISAIGMVVGMLWITPELILLLGLESSTSWYATVGRWVVGALSTVLSAVIGVIGALVLTPPLSSPALEHLVTLQEVELGVPSRPAQSLFAEIWCGLKAQVFALAFAAPLLTAMWLIDVVFPPAVVVTTPLKLLVVALSLAWNLFDYPLTLRGVAASERVGFILGNLSCVLGFGTAFAVLFWIPCFGVLMLPVGAVAATRLVWRMLEAEPLQLPGLARPTPRELVG